VARRRDRLILVVLEARPQPRLSPRRRRHGLTALKLDGGQDGLALLLARFRGDLDVHHASG